MSIFKCSTVLFFLVTLAHSTVFGDEENKSKMAPIVQASTGIADAVTPPVPAMGGSVEVDNAKMAASQKIQEVRMDMMRGEVVKAREVIQSIAATYPDMLEVLQIQVELELQSGAIEPAIQKLTQMLKLSSAAPLRDWTIQTMISAFEKRGTRDALELITKDAALMKEPTVQRQVAMTYRRIGMADKASAIYDQQLKDNPDDLEAIRGVSEVYSMQGEHEKVILLLEPVVQKNPSDMMMQDRLLSAYKALGKREEVLEMIQSQIKTYPDQPWLVEKYCAALSEFGMFDKAVEEWGKLADKNSGNLMYQMNYANALKQAGKKKEAQKAAEKIFKNAGDSPMKSTAEMLLNELRTHEQKRGK